MTTQEIVTAQTTAQLPQAPITFDVPYSLPTGGTTYHVHQGDNLQAVIDNAALGDVIVLDAGAIFTGTFKLPNKTGSGWIYIISSDLASLPAENNRVAPSDAAHMPKLVSSDSNPALFVDWSAHNYRFAGVEFSCGVDNYNLILMGYGLAHYDDPLYTRAVATSVSQLPYNITFDRCYLHSTSDAAKARCGIMADGKYIAVVDSYFSNFKDTSDAQAINVWNGEGPYKIVNNYLEATGENFMSGGTDPKITNAVPSDIEFRGNYCFKPLYWKTDDPSYNGHKWTIKNLFELKNAQRVLVTGNLFENDWSDGQVGVAILITPRNQENTAPWSVVRDVTFRNNIIRHSAGVFGIAGSDNLHPSQQTQRILIENNECEDIELVLGQNCGLRVTKGPDYPIDDLIYRNNLFLFGPAVDSTGNAFMSFSGDGISPDVTSFVYENNIVMFGDYGLIGTGISNATTALTNFTSSYSFQKNVVILRPADRTYAYYLANFSTIYPANNYDPDGVAAVGFTNYANGNYRLATSSPYKNVGTDGKDPGPDWDALDAATAGTITRHAGNCNDFWIQLPGREQ